jgi:2,3-bisphosphoglycerate-dependent phosphoglycerate mutase
VPGLLLLRHAQSVWNAQAKWQGWADPPLSRAGEQQARQAGTRLASGKPFDLVVTSDLERARRTGELVAQRLTPSPPLEVEPGWREYDVGDWTGHTLEEIQARWPKALADFANRQLTAPPGGENRAAFDDRVLDAARVVAARALAAGFPRLLVVVHGGVVRSVAHATGAAEYRVGHLAGYWGTFGEGGFFPTERVNLLDPDPVASGGETAAVEAV